MKSEETRDHNNMYSIHLYAGLISIFFCTISIFVISDTYYSNPQYYFTLKDPDEDDVGGECTCIISLLQKDYRKRKWDPQLRKLFIGFDIHLVGEGYRLFKIPRNVWFHQLK